MSNFQRGDVVAILMSDNPKLPMYEDFLGVYVTANKGEHVIVCVKENRYTNWPVDTVITLLTPISRFT